MPPRSPPINPGALAINPGDREINPVALFLALSCALASLPACQRERSDQSTSQSNPVVVLPDDPARPIAPRPVPDLPLPDKPAITMLPISGPGYQGWIRPVLGDSPERFQPSPQDIALAEAALADAAAAAVTRGEWPAGLELPTYARQYSGHRVHGVDIIRIDLYCEPSNHMASKVAIVSGGGACILHTAYEITGKRFRFFSQNPGR